MSRSIAAPRLLLLLPPSLSNSLAPFLYPCLDSSWHSPTRRSISHAVSRPLRRSSQPRQRRISTSTTRCNSTASTADSPIPDSAHIPEVHHHQQQNSHLDPAPWDYSSAPFTDSCTLGVAAGAGGHGCISFLREKYIANGPPNGGDGGYGGSVYIQAVQGETSLHKIARRGMLKAGRGKNGQGSLKGGARGEDILITVPVGTVVREISRHDPVEEQEKQLQKARLDADLHVQDSEFQREPPAFQRDKWLLYPGELPKNLTYADFPELPRPRRSNLAALQPPAPLRLDLDKPMDTPMLLAAGAMGGLGNPHFVTKSVLKPKYATKGEAGMRINLQLELKLLADVGLVGLPNAGKSTLLRAITRSRTRVGNWAFTTLAPNIGTLVLDNYSGRPRLDTKGRRKEPRTNFTIADIPGLIEGAHQDRGLGLGFLRHIERAAVLAFVVDLSAGDAVTALKSLWQEVGEYEKLRERELNAETERTQPPEDGLLEFKPFQSAISAGFEPEPEPINPEGANDLLSPAVGRKLPPLSLPPISSKPWLVVATKADLDATQDNFVALQSYLKRIQAGEEQHPCGKKNAWKKKLYSVPVSAINREGLATLPEILLGLLDE